MNLSIASFRLALQGTLRGLQARIQIQTPLARTVVLRDPLRQTRAPSYSLMFSTKSMSSNKMYTKTKPKSNPEESASDPLQTSSVSLESLGIGKNMKLLLLAILCVFGTIETWFWCKATWIWWKRGQEVNKEAK
ncbi:hypothetical protein N7476_001039 [Penicillium atrosanguineum]|uniref:Uncharacterized protein n=1 Tax=Penicillium atrosanguineum TaxID=1132637 RepID=A0A9W9QCM5_9EURO|nr:hypothetical protein N7476_001039 [Penicillium atrosanguineum]